MKSIIKESKKSGMVIINVSNSALKGFDREFVGASYRKKAQDHAKWLEKLVKLQEAAKK